MPVNFALRHAVEAAAPAADHGDGHLVVPGAASLMLPPGALELGEASSPVAGITFPEFVLSSRVHRDTLYGKQVIFV